MAPDAPGPLSPGLQADGASQAKSEGAAKLSQGGLRGYQQVSYFLLTVSVLAYWSGLSLTCLLLDDHILTVILI